MRPLLITAVLSCSLSALAADVPPLLSHQGRLMDATGVAVDGNHDLTLTLYDSAAGTTSVWSETVNLDFDQGYFAVILGDASTALAEADIDYDEVWVGLTLDTNPEIPTRQRLTSVPYALKSGRANSADVATSVSGGVVDATEIRVNGTTVIDGSGTIVAGSDGPTIGALSCAADDVPVFDGLDWVCGSNAPSHSHDASEIDSGTLIIDRLPVGTSATDVAAGDHLHALSQLTGVIASSQLPTDFDTVAQAAMGANGAGNPLNHDRYADGEAVAAMGSVGNGNTLNHNRYTNANARNAMNALADSNPLNHNRYEDSEAVGAMGAAADGNPLNHDRYDDADAVGAMGAAADGNTLNHDRYTDGEAQAAASSSFFWGRMSIDSGAWRNSDGDTGTLGTAPDVLANGSTVCDASSVGAATVCAHRMSNTGWRLFFALPANIGGSPWFDGASADPGGFCWGVTTGDNEASTSGHEVTFGRGVQAYGSDDNGNCDANRYITKCAYVDVQSSHVSHEIFGVMCLDPS